VCSFGVSFVAFRVKLGEGFFADVIHDGLHKKVGNVNLLAKSIDQIHARWEVWRFSVIEFCGFVFEEADESYPLYFALESVQVFDHAICSLASVVDE
jgi:hypothetical protein